MLLWPLFAVTCSTQITLTVILFHGIITIIITIIIAAVAVMRVPGLRSRRWAALLQRPQSAQPITLRCCRWLLLLPC
jgi:hypothetical protein